METCFYVYVWLRQDNKHKLNQGTMSLVAQNKALHYKGWKCEKVREN